MGLPLLSPFFRTVGVITLLVVSAHDSHLYYSLSAGGSSFCRWSAAALSAHQGATVLVICRRRRRQEDGGRVQGAYWLSVCSSQTGPMNERNHPSSRLHALFVSPSSQSLSAQLLIISPTRTDSDVCVCMCVSLSVFVCVGFMVSVM